ncbi:MAG: TIGR00266 family protein [Chloroflexota bacterium]|nr:TIGR00266 family protein [Anaerolineae bacterium]HMM29376.1 TIGR00266 family protein [Aggregatilineaceae bacterium]
MQADILYRPSYSMAVVNLAPHEAIRAEVGSLVSMTEGIVIKTGTEGGVLAGLSRALLGGESFFMNVFEAPDWGGQINFAPTLPGDMIILQLENDSLLVQSGSFVASSMGIAIDTKWSGARTFFASEGFVMLRARGTGLLMLSSYGAIHPIDLQPGQRYTVDTGHLVSFTEGIGFKVRAVGGVRSTLFSGEGLVVDLTGPGRVYMQTRSADAFLSWLAAPARGPEEPKK